MPNLVDLLQAVKEAWIVQFDLMCLEVKGDKNAMACLVFKGFLFEFILTDRAVNKAGFTNVTDPVLLCNPAVSDDLVFLLR